MASFVFGFGVARNLILGWWVVLLAWDALGWIVATVLTRNGLMR